MPKYSKEIVKEITDLIKSDSYTVAEICEKVGISQSIFYKWKVDSLEFLEAIKKAEKERLKMFAIEAEKSLLKKIKGYEVEESKTVYSGSDAEDKKAEVKEHTVVKKFIQPDTVAIIFALTNQDSENWKNRTHNQTDITSGGESFGAFLKKANKTNDNGK